MHQISIPRMRTKFFAILISCHFRHQEKELREAIPASEKRRQKDRFRVMGCLNNVKTHKTGDMIQPYSEFVMRL